MKLLNLGGADSTALAEVITDYWMRAQLLLRIQSCLHSFKPYCLYNMHQSNSQYIEYSACSLARHYRTDMNVHNNVLILI